MNGGVDVAAGEINAKMRRRDESKNLKYYGLHQHPRHPLLAILGLGIAVWTPPAFSWEADVHYGLTKWLAYHVGFDLEDAEWIAQGNQGADESSALSATVRVPMAACLLSRLNPDLNASEVVRDVHFPAKGDLPGPVSGRPVIPGAPEIENAGNYSIRTRIGVPPNEPFSVQALRQLGKALHPLADSWSHQGESDEPLLCDPEYVWSHPEKRGGWWSHDADLTWKHKRDTFETARAIYEFLLQYRNDEPRTKWSDIRRDIDAFAEADSIESKYQWFERPSNPVPLESYDAPCFLNTVTLRGFTYPNCLQRREPQWIEELRSMRKPVRSLPPGSKEEMEGREFIGQFLQTWIVDGELDKAINQVDLESFTWAIAENRPERLKLDSHVWAKVLLRMWLILDHGLVNQLGHGMPTEDKRFEELSWMKPSEFDSLEQAIFASLVPKSDTFLVLSDGNAENLAVVAFFQFHHAPHDTIQILASQRSGHWRITGFQWVVNH